MYRVRRAGLLAVCACALLWRGQCAGAAGLQPECPPREGSRCEKGEFSALGEYFYKVDGRNVYINYIVGFHFEMHCDSTNHSSEHPALPRFTELVRVRKVLLRSCAPPAKSYAHVLAALNVSVEDELVLNELPAAPPLRNYHFEGLYSLVRLELNGLQNDAALLPHHILRPLSALQTLVLTHVHPGAELELLPPSLRSLRLWFTETKLEVPAGISKLHRLSVRENSTAFVNVTGATNLEILNLSSPNTSVVGVTSLGSLRWLGIDYWSETRPQPWVECGALEQLTLMDTASRQQIVLPDWWLARCQMLSELSMRRIPLAPLPKQLLGNATALTKLRLSGCNLTELPKDLFSDSVQLTLLDLSYNRLETLSRDIFFSLRALKTLNLSNNLLTTIAAQALQPLSSLTELSLKDNTQLSNLCEGGTDTVITMAGPSPFQLMTDLIRLELRNTSISRVCQDWREGMPQLRFLDLTETKVTELKYADVVQRRSNSGAKMKVGGRNYTIRFEYSSDDYERAKTDFVTSGDLITDISGVVDCDCSAYWAALSFRKGARHSRVTAPLCKGESVSLRNVSLDKLTCPAPELCANLTGCSCGLREDDKWRPDRLAIARCEHQHLTRVPGPLPAGPAWHLQLANNSIANLHLTDLPSKLVELDLRNNSLEKLEQNVAAELFKRRVQLANNPLRCDCDGLALLHEMASRPDNVDRQNVTCRGGIALPPLEQLAAECDSNRFDSTPVTAAIIVIFLVTVTVVVVVVMMVLSRPEMRLRFKIFLDKFGWLPPRREGEGAAEAEDGRMFDAFVSYAHEDEEWVRAALVERLEGAGFRLCVHYRDWAPGEWIPAQIAASVRASRRTLAVVSRHFLKSDWARLEFREAHAQARRDVTPRLVVLLLEEPALLPLDAEMRGFIENNTYVRWGDPWFWKKLQHAMPMRPRRKPCSPSPSPAPATAPAPHEAERAEELHDISADVKSPPSYWSAEPRPLLPHSTDLGFALNSKSTR